MNLGIQRQAVWENEEEDGQQVHDYNSGRSAMKKGFQ